MCERRIIAEGLQFPEGPVAMADGSTHKGGMIQRVDLSTGKFDVLYEACDGQKLNAPNDLVC